VPKTYRELRRRLRSEGWSLVRQRGSHEVWRSPAGDRTVVVAGKDSDVVPRGTLSSIRRATGYGDLR
jgi:predicted RNA binding protein YcfA (HicA-like mRNA interferase family)